MSIRVRFAPSPTGALHIGGIRTALYNYLLAKKHGGVFLLRIEDTDTTRYVEGAEQYIIEALKWCGIAPTEGVGFGDGAYAPYRQSDRFKAGVYQKYADQLVAEGKAYLAFETADQLEAMREKLKAENAPHQSYGSSTRTRTDLGLENSLLINDEEELAILKASKPFVVRLKVPDNQTVTVKDLIRGEVSFNTNELDDKVLLKSDGMPTYHLANIVDDYEMKITHVIRGEEWLPSAGHHALIYAAFGWSDVMPQFAHLPLILKPDGKGKLSKRDGAKFGFPVFPLDWAGKTAEDAFMGFKGAGFDPRAVVNFLTMLGWSSGTEQEIFSMDELAAQFSLERIQKAGARFDYDKAKWFSQQYIMSNSNEELAAQLAPLSKQAGYDVSEAFLARFAGLMKERAVFMNDFLTTGYYFFEPVRAYDMPNATKRWKPENAAKFEDLKNLMATLDYNDPLSMEQAVKEWINANGLKMGEVLPILRIALAGTMQGPAVFDMAALLGEAEVNRRLSRAFEVFGQAH
jgi:glutamyl-tRNA synthetase